MQEPGGGLSLGRRERSSQRDPAIWSTIEGPGGSHASNAVLPVCRKQVLA
jgi:hypothetical protein